MQEPPLRIRTNFSPRRPNGLDRVPSSSLFSLADASWSPMGSRSLVSAFQIYSSPLRDWRPGSAQPALRPEEEKKEKYKLECTSLPCKPIRASRLRGPRPVSYLHFSHLGFLALDGPAPDVRARPPLAKSLSRSICPSIDQFSVMAGPGLLMPGHLVSR